MNIYCVLILNCNVTFHIPVATDVRRRPTLSLCNEILFLIFAVYLTRAGTLIERGHSAYYYYKVLRQADNPFNGKF